MQDMNTWENLIEETDAVKEEDLLMIHKAFPEVIGKKIENICFRSEEGLLEPDIEIEYLRLSVRTHNALKRSGVNGIREVALKRAEAVTEIKNLGAKSVKELITFLRLNAKITCEGEKIDKTVERLFDAVINKIEEERPNADYSFLERSLKIVLSKNKEHLTCDTKEEMAQVLFSDAFTEFVSKSEEIQKAFEKYFLSTIFDSRKSIPLSRVEEAVPSIFLYEGMGLNLVTSLETDRKIEKYKDGYRLRLPYLKEWVDTLADNRKAAMTLRLQGKTLGECGNVLGVTRERVRQLVSMSVKSKPVLREDDYAYWFCEYDIDEEAMKLIFEVPQETYIYFTAVYNHGKKSVDDLCDDSHITSKIYINYLEYVNRNSILIGDEYVPCKRELLCRKLAQALCSENEMEFGEFYRHYLELLEKNGLMENEKLLFPSERAFEARVADSFYVLMKYGKRMRYYPLHEYDVEELVRELHFEQFRDVEISALKLFREYREVMEEFNIMDEYELHNFLNKTKDIWNADEKYHVQLTRMPLMTFGKADRAKQTENFLYQIAPVSFEEFGKFYEMEYGVLARTVLSNMTPYISTYYHEGYFKVDQPRLTEDESAFLKDALTEDFYFVEDVKTLYIQKFGDATIDHMNPRSYKELGFKVFTNYLVRNTYMSADDYFTKLFTRDTLLDMNKFDSRLIYVQSANQALDTLRANYDMLEYEDKKYISYEHFANVAEGVTKENLLDYVDEAVKAAGEGKFFTIQSLKRKGFTSELHNLGLGDWFNGGLLKNSKKIKYIKTASGIIFCNLGKAVTQVDFFAYILKDKRKMDIFDFIDYIRENYGITIQKDKITWIIRESHLYYDSIMEKIYYDKEDYYDEF